MDIQGVLTAQPSAAVPLKKTPHIRLALCRDAMSKSMQEVANSPGRTFKPSKASHSKSKLPVVKFVPSSNSAAQEIFLQIPPDPPSARNFTRENIEELKYLLLQNVAHSPFHENIKEWAERVANDFPEQESALLLGKALVVAEHTLKDDFNIDKDLERLFLQEIKKISVKIDKCSSEAEIRLTLAREAASLLITSKGQLNYGLCPFLVVFFNTHAAKGFGFKNNFDSFLEMLVDSDGLRNQLTDISHPKKGNFLSNELIKCCLLLPSHTNVHSYHAKRCALMACLSYPRQAGAGNCFALAVAISLFSSSIEKCLGDFREILEYGYLKRYVEDKSISFPGLMRQPLIHVHKPLTASIPELINSPKIKFILEQTHAKLPDVIPEVRTVDELLYLLGPEAWHQGRFLYESFFENPLIAVWINILASMAEGRSDGLIKSAIVKSCLIAAQEDGVDEEERTTLKQGLFRRVYLHYDPSIMSLDPHDESGAFILYEKRKGYFRVDGSSKFQTFLSTVSTSKTIVQWALKPSTLNRIVGLYAKGADLDIKAIQEIDQLKRSPWKTELGNNPGSLLTTYNSIAPSNLTFQPKSVEELFIKIVGFWRNYKPYESPKNKGSAINRGHLKRIHSSVHIPTRIVAFHSFNLILNDKNMHDCLLGDPQTTLDNRKKKALELGNLKVPIELYKRLKAYLLELYKEITPFLNKMPENATLISFREYLTTKFKEDFVDRTLYEFFPEGIKKEMSLEAIRFGDSNRQLNGQDIHYAFCYHPASQKLSIFQQLESGELLAPLLPDDQTKLGNWEILGN